MKILLIGFLAFIGWSAFSDYIYVCRIRGYCSEPVPVQIPDKQQTVFYAPDSAIVPEINDSILKPEKLIFYFEYDKSELLRVSDADNFLVESAGYFNQHPDAKLKITGYTDSVGTFEYNMALGKRRAQSVQTYFESKGIQSDRLVIQSKGESEPTESNSSTNGRAKNRRTEITINN